MPHGPSLPCQCCAGSAGVLTEFAAPRHALCPPVWKEGMTIVTKQEENGNDFLEDWITKAHVFI